MEDAMSIRPFRFIHAADFRLGQPLWGVSEVPEHLRDLFLDSPYTAARRVFDAALVEGVDFVVLSGGIVSPAISGPRGPLFVAEQCTRLAERGIGVYWAGSLNDPTDVWPTGIRLPQNVHFFLRGRVEEVLVPGEGGPLAKLAGISCAERRVWRSGDFQSDAAGLYTIAVAHGETDLTLLGSRGLHYWALGGRSDRSTPCSGPQIVHYCGTPQGRRPEETGTHGCTLVQVDQEGQTRTSLIPTDATRWMTERVAIDETTVAEDLEARLRQRMHAMLEAMPSTALLVSWRIAGSGSLLASIRRGALGTRLLDRLRGDYGYRSPPAWSVSLEVELSETLPPEWYEQETIRGDFLRAIRQLQMNPEDPICLEQYLAESHRAGTLAEAVAMLGKSRREAVLREAAALGVDLLSGEESHS
jgi:DNA repair protein SbcD/Mre11